MYVSISVLTKTTVKVNFISQCSSASSSGDAFVSFEPPLHLCRRVSSPVMSVILDFTSVYFE